MTTIPTAVMARPAKRLIIEDGMKKSGNGNGFVVDRFEMAIIAIEVVSAFSCVPA